MLNERHVFSEDAFVEIVVWRLPAPLSGSWHAYKFTTPEKLLDDFWDDVDKRRL